MKKKGGAMVRNGLPHSLPFPPPIPNLASPGPGRPGSVVGVVDFPQVNRVSAEVRDAREASDVIPE